MKEIIRIIGIIIKSFLENCKDFFVYVGKTISNFLSTNVGQVFLVLTVLVTLIVVSIILYREIKKIHAKINIIGHFPDVEYDEEELEELEELEVFESIERVEEPEIESESAIVEKRQEEQEAFKKEALIEEEVAIEQRLEEAEEVAIEQMLEEAVEEAVKEIPKEPEQPVLAIFEEVQKTEVKIPDKREGPEHMQAQIRGRLVALEEKVSSMEDVLCPEHVKTDEACERQKEIERLKKKIVTLKSLIIYYEELE